MLLATARPAPSRRAAAFELGVGGEVCTSLHRCAGDARLTHRSTASAAAKPVTAASQRHGSGRPRRRPVSASAAVYGGELRGAGFTHEGRLDGMVGPLGDPIESRRPACCSRGGWR